MPLPSKIQSRLILASFLSVTSILPVCADTSVKSEAEDSTIVSISKDAPSKTQKNSLEVVDRVFGIPILGSLDTDKETLTRSKDVLTKTLDQDNDGNADTPKLTEFMARNGFKVVVTATDYDLDELDDDEYPYEKTALITGNGLKVDSYLLENLRIVAEGYLALLTEQASRNDQESQEKLGALDKAIAQIREQGLSIDVSDDDELDDATEDDGIDDDMDSRADYIMLGTILMSGQLSSVFDRIVFVLNETLTQASAITGKDYQEAKNQILPEAQVRWKQMTTSDFQQTLPLLYQWLQVNKISAPIVSLTDITPKVTKEDLDDFISEGEDDSENPSEEGESQDQKQQSTEPL